MIKLVIRMEDTNILSGMEISNATKLTKEQFLVDE